MNSSPSVTVMGLGYVGLPTAALIASKGIQVLGVDIEEKVVDTINEGRIHIVEPDLEGLVNYVVTRGLLRASTRTEPTDVFIVAVPTPFKEGHVPDLSWVEAAFSMIAPVLREGNLVILESTSPVGTTERMYEILVEQRPELRGRIHVAYCPERVLPGRVLYELENNDRVVGGIDLASARKAKEFYSLFVKGAVWISDSRTAEMCKLVENAYRDVNIAFANELSLICEEAGIDVWKLIELANRHPRVNILSPGVGVGGHCIAVDPWFLIVNFPQESGLMRRAREVNTNKTQWVLKRIKEAIGSFREREGRAPRVACLGVSYKPDIDDVRESPALWIVKNLLEAGEEIWPVDPYISEVEGVPLFGLQEALEASDIVVLLVAHKSFTRLTLPEEKIVLDFCGITRWQR